ncbi:protein ELYS isoform X2 [Oryzias latipes]|uniref:AT hook containing transcription factor 1 n=1 Tax=Oryzias latipes TaxID=8090 RepID=A0A3B3HNQ3_ORYLA|nr:protein ELYS isoform X2 [Oryzias latipes]
MHDLIAQVTSSLLPFSGVTIEALGEDEITLDSVLQARFTVGRIGLAWLACGPHLEVVHAVTGERLSAYCFSTGGEHPPRILSARDFSWLKRSGLLVALEETEGSVLCLYDLGLSKVVKAVVIPGRITAIEPLASYGGASTSTQHLHQSLRWFFGIAAVVTDLGHVLLVDLCLDDLSCSQSELDASDLQIVTKSPADIPRLREVSTRQGRHLCLQLNGPAGVGVTAIQYISRTNQLAVGFSDGHLQLWNMKSLKKEYHSQLEGGRVPVHAFTFQEPENDPRNCCYLWAVQSSQDLEGDIVSLHLLQLAFSERKCLASGKILYEGLEYCEERYNQDLSGTTFPRRAQASNTHLLSCQTIEKFRYHPDRDDSMNEVASPDTSLSIFSWQVKVYGQGNPSSYIGVFDINRWYHAQMPDSLRTGESLQNCPYLAVWCLDPVVQMVSPHNLLDVIVHERSLSRGLPFTCPPPEQYFNPTTFNFDATCLTNSGIVHLTCSGYQKETLSFLKKAAPCTSEIISSSYSRCLMSGLLSARLTDMQTSRLSQEDQLDAILTTAVETSSLGLITGSIKQWTAEEQPGSALNLRYIMDWAWNKVVQTKEELDGICAPLFDSSSNFTDPQTLQLLRHSERLLSNLSAVFHCLLSEAQELTQKGLAGLMNKNMVSSLISNYAQVVLWFCRTGLLPERSDEDALQISRPFYAQSVISNYYTIRREELTRLAKHKWSADCLMIDGLVAQCGERLTSLWKRDEGGTGQYPPPTLHALLDIYLLENIDEAAKHAIVIYLLLDVMYSFPNKDGASVESFPTAFAIPIGLVKLVQGLWLLDHNDHQSSFELLLHPAASRFHFEWQHERILQALMSQEQHSVALRYFHVTKPPISSTAQARLCLSVLLHSRCLIEAWCLLRQHSHRLNGSELLGFLYESCQELGLTKELLKLPLAANEQECLEKFLQGTGGLQNRELLMVHYLQQANYIPALQLNNSLKRNLVNERDPKLKERSNIRNSIMDQYGKVLPRVQRKLAVERAKPYQHPNTIHKEVSRPQPLSTITKPSANEKVMSRAGFINTVLTKIEEVWLGKDTPSSSPAKSVRTPDAQRLGQKQSSTSSAAFPDPFLGTPITLTSKRKSRLIDLVVHPSCQTPRPLLSPPRLPSSRLSPSGIKKAPELSLLQTPQVVKRARALAASGPGFSAFTPQSILRSSLRPTPVVTPSASPGRSVTPPLRSKDGRITFSEQAVASETEKSIRWTNGMAADSEISLLTKGSPLTKPTRKTWSSQLAEREEEEEKHRVTFLAPKGGASSQRLRCSESDSSSTNEVAAETSPSAPVSAGFNLSLDTSQVSFQSTNTTLEYFDADEPTNVCTDEDDDVVTVNIKPQMEKEASEINLTVEDAEKKEELVKEDTMKITPEEKSEEEVESSSKTEHVETADHEEPSVRPKDKEETESSASEVKSLELPAKDEEPAVQSKTPESLESGSELSKASGEAETPTVTTETLDQSTDLTEFVQQHLFGSDQSPPLSRSSIHNASQSQSSLNSEQFDEEQVAATAAPVLNTQNSTASVTSSEPTGTDSHSVVSVNDSGDLSSPESEGEEEEESSDQAEGQDDDDSGSEVEIIEEVQGNGRLPPLQPSSLFEQQQDFMPSLSEQEAAEFSLLTPSSEMKMVDVEGEVVMVRLGADEGGLDQDEGEDQCSSYMELKPSATLLVPVELMQDQHSLADGALLGLPELQADELQPETHSSFTLMLDVDEVNQAGAPPVQNDLQPPDLSIKPHEVDFGDNFLDMPDIVPVEMEDQLSSPSGEASLEGKGSDLEILDGNDVDEKNKVEVVEPLPDLQTECSASKQENEVSGEENNVQLEQLPVDHGSAPPSESSTTSGEHPSDEKTEAPVEKMESVDEEMKEEDQSAPEEPKLEDESAPEEPKLEDQSAPEEPKLEDQSAPEEPKLEDQSAPEEPKLEDQSAPEEPKLEDELAPEEPKLEDELAPEEPKLEDTNVVSTDSEFVLCKEVDAAVETEEQQEHTASTETEEEAAITTAKNVEEEESVGEVLSLGNKHHVQQTPTSQQKPPSTPTRRMTRGRSVTFISTLPEESSDAKEDSKEPKKSNLVSTSPGPTLRKAKQVKETKLGIDTPRRSNRRTLPDPPKNNAEESEATNADFSMTVTSNSSPVRRSPRKSPARTSLKQRPVSGETSAASEAETKDTQDKEEAEHQTIGGQKGSKARTPSKSRTSSASTPRRSSRRTQNSSESELEVVMEEKDEPPPFKRSSRRTTKQPLEALPAPIEEDDTEPPSSERKTRQSSLVKLNVYPQYDRKTRGKVAITTKDHEDVRQPEGSRDASRSSSRRPTRSKLWDHPEEDLHLLDSPLEVDSKTPVADALIKRLQDEEEQQEGGGTKKMTRIRTRSSKSSVKPVSPQPQSPVPEPKEEESSPEELSFIYSPSRRRQTKVHQAESPRPSEESVPPLTRSRRRVNSIDPQEKISSEEDHVDVENAPSVPKTKKTSNRTSRSRAARDPPPIAAVDTISPLPSPADPLPRALKRITEQDLPTTSRNLRRKRVMDTVFTKPVTRRRKM